MTPVPHTHRTDWTPETARAAIHSRQGGLCALCWLGLGGVEDRWEAHHRLRRQLMPSDARWCPCDLVGLHARCHTQGDRAVHDHPENAHQLGLVLLSFEDPRTIPVPIRWPWEGHAFLACDSSVVSPHHSDAGAS